MKNKAEIYHDRSFKGIVWQKENSPAFLSMISLNSYKSDRIRNRLNRVNF
jgi:hypothetical protein